jgi:predicted DNA-binding mobile mystery protein A
MDQSHQRIVMPDFLQRRRLARILDRSAVQLGNIRQPEKGWIATMRLALGMSAENVARRKGVSRNAVYQAERSEQDGAISLKQMEAIAKAMGGTFVYAIVPSAPVEQLKHQQAVHRAHALSAQEPAYAKWSINDQQDWIDDATAKLLHDMPPSFWDHE